MLDPGLVKVGISAILTEVCRHYVEVTTACLKNKNCKWY